MTFNQELNIRSVMYIPYQEIADNLGLKSDDTLLIASDISQLVYYTFKNKEKFDSDLLIDSFKRVLKDGTLLLPAFIDNFQSGDIFDKLKNIPEMGTLSKVAFKRTDFIRSNDPLHSFMVQGKHAIDIASITCDSTFGEKSVFAYLKNVKAKMLLIDVDLEHSFTFAHFVEENQKVAYRKFVDLAYLFRNDLDKLENRTLKIYAKKKGIINTLNKLESILMEKGAMEQVEINKSVFRLIHLEKAYDVICEDINFNGGKNLHAFEIQNFIKSTVKSILRK